jgi:hypothetical protein
MGERGEKVDSDLLVLTRFVEIYCWKQHGRRKGELCGECRELLDYACERRKSCPHEPKPKCKDCCTHCYRPDARAKIREIMRYSGTYYIKRGRLDWLFRYFWS